MFGPSDDIARMIDEQLEREERAWEEGDLTCLLDAIVKRKAYESLVFENNEGHEHDEKQR